MIEVKNLSKRYGWHQAVQDLSFSIDDGEVVGFLGPNGAGKSTTMNILTGYLSATGGTAKINGYDVLEQPNQAKQCIGYLPEQPPLYLDLTVREYLEYVFDLKKCKLPRQEHIAEVCRLVKIEKEYKRLIRTLSKGYRQRVGLAQALIGNPPVIILDEPTVGLDPNQIIEIRSLIKKLGETHTVILSSHILQEIEAVCNRIVIINQGQLIEDDSPQHLLYKHSDDNSTVIRVAGNENDVAKALVHINGVKDVVKRGEKEPGVFEFAITPVDAVDIRREIFNRMSDRNWPILSMKSSVMTLEDVFIKLTTVQNAKGAKR